MGNGVPASVQAVYGGVPIQSIDHALKDRVLLLGEDTGRLRTDQSKKLWIIDYVQDQDIAHGKKFQGMTRDIMIQLAYITDLRMFNQLTHQGDSGNIMIIPVTARREEKGRTPIIRLSRSIFPLAFQYPDMDHLVEGV